MKKMYVNINELNEEEKRTGRVSYTRLVEHIIGKEIVLCNNIVEKDEFIFDGLNKNAFDEDENLVDIYQWYLCNLDDWQKEKAEEMGLILTYSPLLELDVLCVDHYGTSWDYVMTDIEWTENFEEV